MQYGHTACSKDMHQGHAAWTCGMPKRPANAARTSSIDKQHGQAGLHFNDMQHGNAEGHKMQHGHAVLTL